ncbi:hypothetical protein M3221_17505 [Domibacillus indicus]|uniref:hypothetical protein n=1 Tax=Domibacillus indicus TaxID=1437523 RepID=UPI00203EA8DA|nr:hypothetical protein [Domibacillus indicus]MCM3790181.1 hypothetical protein [Domibacillus indicus]
MQQIVAPGRDVKKSTGYHEGIVFAEVDMRCEILRARTEDHLGGIMLKTGDRMLKKTGETNMNVISRGKSLIEQEKYLLFQVPKTVQRKCPSKAFSWAAYSISGNEQAVMVAGDKNLRKISFFRMNFHRGLCKQHYQYEDVSLQG